MKKKVVKKKPTKKRTTKKFNHRVRTEYLKAVYGPSFLTKIPKAIKMLKAFRKKHPFDAIAFRGSSGAAFAYPLSYLMKMPLIHVRRGDEQHYRGKIEGTVSAKKYVIVDDFISSGSTISKIENTISGEIEANPELVGILLYASNKLKQWHGVPVMTMPYVSSDY